MLTALYNRAWPMQLGVTLVELMVALVVFAILVAVGAPNVMNWVQSSQIRTASESILNGLQLARAEAVRRNSYASFVLCGGSSGDSTWDVLAVSAPAKAQACGSDATTATGWARVQSHSGTEGSPNAQVNVKQNGTAYNTATNPIVYDGLGRLSTIQPKEIDFNVNNPKGGNCVSDAPSGPMRCMRVVVSTGGGVRMCNPAYSIANNPQGCP